MSKFYTLKNYILVRLLDHLCLKSIDKAFGFLFGFFKGYVVSVCLFSILNWFYPYQNWGISADKALSFDFIMKGSQILIEEFPTSEDIIDTKEKIEKI